MKADPELRAIYELALRLGMSAREVMEMDEKEVHNWWALLLLKGEDAKEYK